MVGRREPTGYAVIKCAPHNTHLVGQRSSDQPSPPLARRRNTGGAFQSITSHQKIVRTCLPVMLSHPPRFSLVSFVHPFKAPMSPDGEVWRWVPTDHESA